MTSLAARWRRLADWMADLAESAGLVPWRNGAEYPWRQRGLHYPTFRAGSPEAVLVLQRAQATLGPDAWQQLMRDGYLDVPSRHNQGVTYRLRVGRRVEVVCAAGVRSPWPHPYLCVSPAYPLPRLEFLAHLYLYARDREEELTRAGLPTPLDGPTVPAF
jgi:hypothetical protein